MAAVTIPETHRYLLESPSFGHLCTIRPDGSPQSSVMWFHWDGELLRFTHRTDRQKYRNFQHDPRVSLSVHDHDQPYRFLEVRGVVETIEPDGDVRFYKALQKRYGQDNPPMPGDAETRVVIVVRPTKVVAVDHGLTTPELNRIVKALEGLESDQT